jgi:cyclopropane fatty-acyl-phospholipid synthase-like methyltransferase
MPPQFPGRLPRPQHQSGNAVTVGSDETEREQRELVRKGYDVISRRYRDDEGLPTAAYQTWLDELGTLLRPGAMVLDLGCGAGVPAGRILADRGFTVTGLDISSVQIERARALVPGARFVQADMADWDCEAGSYAAIVALYALIHLPLSDQRRLFPRMARWLTPGGYLLAIVGHQRWTGVEDYLGAPMFWDHADTPTYLEWLQEAGLTVLWHRVIPDGSSSHTLVLAQAGPTAYG